MIHIVEVKSDRKIMAYQIQTHDSLKKTDSELMKAFLVKNRGSIGSVFAPISGKIRLNQIVYRPWETIVPSE